MNFTTEYEYKQVSTKNILVDPMYQRELNPAKVSQIVSDFDPRLVNAVKVSYREGRYYVFDGQHTMAALKAKHRGQDCMIECKVFYGLTWFDEAHLFLLQNGHSSGVEINAKFRALMNMGDPEVTRMVRLAEKVGITIDFKKSKAQNKIIAISTLFRIFKNNSERDYLDILHIIKSAWGGTPESFSKEILLGVAAFHRVYRGQYKPKKLIDRLTQTSPTAIIREGKVSMATGDKKYARQILNAYNYNASKNRLPDLL